MTDVPSTFSRTDFYGLLLPGYLILVVSLLLFKPDLLFNVPGSLDLFSTIVFVVAGPAVGLILQTSHRIVLANIWERSRAKKGEYREFSRKYYHARLDATPSERLELETSESLFDFNVSSLIGLTALSIVYFIARGIALVSQVSFLLIADILFIAGAYFARDDYTYVIEELIEKHPS